MIRAEDLARSNRGRKIGRDRWRCECPVHKGRSLDVALGKSGTVIIKCWGGCSTEDVLAALGLGWKDILRERGQLPPEQRQRLRDEKRLAAMERRLGLVIMAQAVMPREKRYWQAAEKQLAKDIENLKDKTKPGRAEAREKRAKLDWFIAKFGWDRLWEEFLKTDQGQEVEFMYAIESSPHESQTEPETISPWYSPW